MSFRWEAQRAILGAMTENELAAASRNELIVLIRPMAMISERQKTVIAARLARISALQQKLAGRSGPGMPGSKPARPKPETVVPPQGACCRGREAVSLVLEASRPRRSYSPGSGERLLGVLLRAKRPATTRTTASAKKAIACL
jgi:hypothetical protein